MPPQPVRIFVTGGTFDKEYNERNGTLFFQDTHVPEMLRLGRCLLDTAIQTLLMIDSLEMSEADRRLIAEHCRIAPENQDRHHPRYRHQWSRPPPTWAGKSKARPSC